MNFNQIKENTKSIINKFSSVSDRSLDLVSKLIEIEVYEKGDVFIDKGKNNNSEYFVFEGICRSFLLNPDGEEVTISFFLDDGVLSPNKTRTANQISQLNFQALTKITLASFNADKFEQLMINHIDIREFGNMVLQNELLTKVEKEIGLASFTAKERLIFFREKYHFLENLISHVDIASYLGITNVSLSRLRKDLTS
ncbi:Crp/Fnr family transcriptional regulator [Polaribacter dokdonensis]|uniref:Transcriptional regulator, crp/fnr family protein n=1 Tax=Polaribacter dokdonensis DSW-5 TaxID=1300348 RepID=A0A0M9CIH5_9FLAO|nr:Crp/Fnr family transcriptional regulator [Polaribacter dokdonensis]KOY53116.1 transcriptional regulator, crp/fnr family protein [Polaribacter dokdonensis DSW-5]SEE57342.1 cAMP-binding domain of CRP or a regulatory subunit of cAMP-dependent protein kinases [Polaribacter dokdonensis DSW-5]